MNHSSAPWEAVATKQGIVVLGERVPVTPDQVERFGCDPASVVAPTICTVAVGNRNKEADAALIVAAPELLAALRPFAAMNDHHSDGCTCDYCAARTAISKAESKQ